MSANIIKFPTSKKKLELEAMETFNVSPNTSTINGIPVENPKTAREYLEICKEFLEVEDYQDVLCGIMDDEHYDALEPKVQKIINCYYSFKK